MAREPDKEEGAIRRSTDGRQGTGEMSALGDEPGRAKELLEALDAIRTIKQRARAGQRRKT